MPVGSRAEKMESLPWSCISMNHISMFILLQSLYLGSFLRNFSASRCRIFYWIWLKELSVFTILGCHLSNLWLLSHKEVFVCIIFFKKMWLISFQGMLVLKYKFLLVLNPKVLCLMLCNLWLLARGVGCLSEGRRHQTVFLKITRQLLFFAEFLLQFHSILAERQISLVHTLVRDHGWE